MKKLSRIFLATAMLAGGAAALTGCDVKAAEYKPGEAVKVGLICLHDETSTYDNNFIKEMANAATALGGKMAEPIIKTGVGENKECFNAAKESHPKKAGSSLSGADDAHWQGHRTKPSQPSAAGYADHGLGGRWGLFFREPENDRYSERHLRRRGNNPHFTQHRFGGHNTVRGTWIFSLLYQESGIRFHCCL